MGLSISCRASRIVALFLLCCLPVICTAQAIPLFFSQPEVTSATFWGGTYEGQVFAVSGAFPTRITTMTLHIQENSKEKRIDETPYSLAEDFLPLQKQIVIPAIRERSSHSISWEGNFGSGLRGIVAFRYCTDQQDLCTPKFEINYRTRPPYYSTTGFWELSTTTPTVVSGSCDPPISKGAQRIRIAQTSNTASYLLTDGLGRRRTLSANISGDISIVDTYVFTTQYRIASFLGTIIEKTVFSDNDNGSGRAYWSYQTGTEDVCNGTYDVQYRRLPVEVQIRVLLEGAIASTIDICNRTEQVKNKILALSGNNDCKGIFEPDLNAITTMDLSLSGIDSLSAGDFSGLTKLEVLNLSDNYGLSTLPSGIFNGLINLQTLFLSNIFLEENSLALDLFDNLPNLQQLDLTGNSLGNDYCDALRTRLMQRLGRDVLGIDCD